MKQSQVQAALASPLVLFALLFVTVPQSKAVEPVRNVAPNLHLATDVGPMSSDAEMNLTVHLKMNNRAAFDAAVEELYNPKSPTYQKWMTDADLLKYAPSAKSVASVKAELQKHGLSIVSMDPLGFSIRVHGTTASIESAFQTHIHEFTARKKTFQAHVVDAHLAGEADEYVASISGLDRYQIRPRPSRSKVLGKGNALASIPLAKVQADGGLGSVETDVCLTGPGGVTYSTTGAPLPTAVYFGNLYDNYPLLACGFTSTQLQAHYGLPAAYSKGLNGAGQTIVLVEGYGYPNILADANAFSKLSGLPALNSSNFEIIYPEGKPKNPNAGVELGWDVEIALDVQWSHSIAPGAKIVVAAVAGQDSEDFQNAITYIANNKIGNSVSNSWEEDNEQFTGPYEVSSFNTSLELAAAKGISVNFSTGDSGDEGNGSPIGAPNVPADSPYATAVGGTSILNNVTGSGFVETGWGNDIAFVADFNYNPYDPPNAPGNVEFYFGGGGGESVYFAKPSWQSGLPGTGRQIPDVSALADPFTGVSIVLTSQGQQTVQPGWGGTSLACPIFSAIWAIANQNAGHPLGQAARKLPTLTASEITDVKPQSTPTNVSGIVIDANGPTYYPPLSLFAGSLGNTTELISGISPVNALVISFGTDSSLKVTKGWDNVTGYGVPNGLAFITAAGH